MEQKIAHVSLLVKDYDEAIEFYTKKLNFKLIEDKKLGENKRWVIVSPQGNSDTNLLLAKYTNEEQKSRVGNQTGGRVFLFLYTDNFERDLENFKKNNIHIVSEPRNEEFGKVLVFQDLYGNLWDLLEPIKKIN